MNLLYFFRIVCIPLLIRFTLRYKKSKFLHIFLKYVCSVKTFF